MFYSKQNQCQRDVKTSCTYEEYRKLRSSEINTIQVRLLSELMSDMQRRTALIVYLMLAELATNQEGKRYTITMSYRELASLMKVSSRTAIRTLEYLKTKGYIEVVQVGNRKEGYSPNKIKVRFPKYLLSRIFDSYESLAICNNSLKESSNEQENTTENL